MPVITVHKVDDAHNPHDAIFGGAANVEREQRCALAIPIHDIDNGDAEASCQLADVQVLGGAVDTVAAGRKPAA